MAKVHSRQALQWIDNDGRGASVLFTAQRLLALEQSLRQLLPANLRQGFAVAELSGEDLTLMTYNTAFAAKIRQFQPRFIEQLKADGWPVTAIRIRVSAEPRPNHATKPERLARTLDKEDLNHFDRLAQTLRPGPLADSVNKLLAHHRKPPNTK
jgi:hypothetical protein